MKIVSAYCIKKDSDVLGRFFKEEDAVKYLRTLHGSGVSEEDMSRALGLSESIAACVARALGHSSAGATYQPLSKAPTRAHVEPCFVLEVPQERGPSIYFDLQQVGVVG